MTINQFKEINSDQQLRTIIDLRDLCRYYHDQLDWIAMYQFRDVSEKGWPVRRRPANAETNRQYDYIYGTWLFLHQLKTQLEIIRCHTIDNEF